MPAVKSNHLRPPWQPGQSGNPGGIPKLSPELRAIKALSADEMARIVAKYGRMPAPNLDQVVLEATAPTLELAVASILQSVYKKGDAAKLEILLARALGKVKEAPPPDPEEEALKAIQDMSDGDLLQLIKGRVEGVA